MSERTRITLDEDDLGPEAPGSPITSPPSVPTREPALAALPPVQQRRPTRIGYGDHQAVGAGSGDADLLHDPRTSTLIAGGLGMAAAWVLTEATGVSDMAGSSKFSIDMQAGLWTALIGSIFAAVVTGFPLAVDGGLQAGMPRVVRVLAPAAGAGFVGGFIAQAIYAAIAESVFRSALEDPDGSFSAHDPGLYFARCLGWAIFGAGLGASAGVVDRSQKRAINGALGGAIGGAVGGLAFHFITATALLGQSPSRLVGLLAIGGCIVVATRSVETARRQAWLQVVRGGMTGKEFVLYHPVTRVGASPDCEIFVLKDPSVAPLHVSIADDGVRRTIRPAPAAPPVLVNGAPSDERQLRPGDQIQIGSTVLAYSERA